MADDIRSLCRQLTTSSHRRLLSFKTAFTDLRPDLLFQSIFVPLAPLWLFFPFVFPCGIDQVRLHAISYRYRYRYSQCTAKKYPYIRGYFAASFPYCNGTGSVKMRKIRKCGEFFTVWAAADRRRDDGNGNVDASQPNDEDIVVRPTLRCCVGLL